MSPVDLQAQVETPTAQEPFDLNVTIVEQGAAAAALLCSTDNGCDTKTDGDC
ncbi:FxLD family lanthipeptide [Frankia sp. AgB1.9]|uniref:FxLD family lanthipeptide n=1 Tax=unclassified Frankia TaxID=2632575 RepID=UPI0019338FB2|nr:MULTISPECIES: FxLD family lanthipeptide [unclassified Frankia]MBL7489732.1 FxLD family lanthipeptide [Frankia sp. AgW1.1]MBL7551942.1 FxLD family lanthipeptide [Frankia sp. AgB1.9]MBL7623219.1 FxLD family lanthipeptide [Frankia sp. AgB1.8]